MTKGTVIVIGAGVIGLTTAIKLQELGYRVIIIAKHLPGDAKVIEYTSPWAGAHHLSSATPAEMQVHQFDLEGFAVMSSLLSDPAAGLSMRPQREYRDYARQLNADGLDQISLLARYQPNFRMLSEHELPAGVVHGAAFDTINIDVPRYLPYLLARFRAAGGHILRADIPSLQRVASFTHPDLGLPSVGHALAVINCTGLSARRFVPDGAVHPVRGQVLVVRAPWVTGGITYVTSEQSKAPHYRGYVIPRNATDIIIGGTSAPDDWDPTPREDITRLILERGVAMCPELLSPEKRAGGRWQDVEVVEVGVGLRPARNGGLRLETEWLAGEGGKETLVVHNYGHGGAGYQNSWGCARAAVELLESALRSRPHKPAKL